MRNFIKSQLALFVMGMILVISYKVFAEDVDVMCKAKAKSTAIDVYKTCVTENRSAQIEQIRKNYSEKLKNLKDDYEQDIKRLGGKSNRDKTSNVRNSKRVTKNRSESIEVEKQSDDSVMDIPEPIPVEKYN